MKGKKIKGNNFQTFESVTSNARHYRITLNMVASLAWESLKIYDRDLYHAMKSKYNNKNIDNISFTYEEGMKLMSKANFTKAIDSLIEHGFIKIVINGRYYRKPNIYGFTNSWQKWPEVKIIPRLKRAKMDTEKSEYLKGKKEILARSKITQCSRSNMTNDEIKNA